MEHSNLPQLSRRKFFTAVSTVAIASIAGCSSGESREPSTVELNVTASDGTQETQIWENDETTLESGEYSSWEFMLTGELEVTYDVNVVEGNSVNVYLLDDAEREELKNEEDFTAIENTIHSGINEAKNTVTLGEGDYWVFAVNADLMPENA